MRTNGRCCLWRGKKKYEKSEEKSFQNNKFWAFILLFFFLFVKARLFIVFPEVCTVYQMHKQQNMRKRRNERETTTTEKNMKRKRKNKKKKPMKCIHNMHRRCKTILTTVQLHHHQVYSVNGIVHFRNVFQSTKIVVKPKCLTTTLFVRKAWSVLSVVFRIFFNSLYTKCILKERKWERNLISKYPNVA